MLPRTDPAVEMMDAVRVLGTGDLSCLCMLRAARCTLLRPSSLTRLEDWPQPRLTTADLALHSLTLLPARNTTGPLSRVVELLCAVGLVCAAPWSSCPAAVRRRPPPQPSASQSPRESEGQRFAQP